MHPDAVNLHLHLQKIVFLVLIEIACDVGGHQVSYVAIASYTAVANIYLDRC
jgi:hypothetical protein